MARPTSDNPEHGSHLQEQMPLQGQVAGSLVFNVQVNTSPAAAQNPDKDCRWFNLATTLA